MWIELPKIWIALLNAIGIPIAHLGLSWITSKLPNSWFELNPNQNENSLHRSIQFYERIFQVRKWKNKLPDAATWFGGPPKSITSKRDLTAVQDLLTESRRGEFCHWLQLLFIIGFIAWTPSPLHWVIVFYAIASNLPCLISLRHTIARCKMTIAKLEA